MDSIPPNRMSRPPANETGVLGASSSWTPQGSTSGSRAGPRAGGAPKTGCLNTAGSAAGPRDPGSFSRRSSGAPQAPQRSAPSMTSSPHFGHFMGPTGLMRQGP